MHLYNFGLSQEDERTEASALDVGAGRGRVLSVASAGEMPLSLLALGADRVVAVDVDARQMHLVRLKLAAATRLGREDAICFLGYLPARPAKRRRWLGDVMSGLPRSSVDFWRANERALLGGAVWAGRFERYIRRVAAVAVPLFGRRRLEGLLDCATLAEQEAHFDRNFRPAALRALFRIAFHPRLYSRRGMDPRSLRHRASTESLGDQFFGWFRTLCTATPARDNHFLQLFVLGRVLGVDSVPAYLTAAGHPRLCANLDRLTLVEKDIVSVLRDPRVDDLDAAHLSNITDWLGPEDFAEVMRLLCDRLARPARVVWRYLHVDRPVPEDLTERIRVDYELGEVLRRRDRFPFYTIVPASLP